MEIHHQHHHDHPQHKEKLWKHYALEFFMLFLAVFCGFLAENYREQLVDHRLEKEYMQSMLEDLKSDTAQYHQRIEEINHKINLKDSLLLSLSDPGVFSNSNRAYFYFTGSYHFPDFIYSDRTIQQLKNSGGMRLIRNKEVADSIMQYDSGVRTLFVHQQQMNSVALLFIESVNKFFWKRMLEASEPGYEKPIPLLSQNKTDLEEFYNNMSDQKKGFQLLTEIEKNLLQQATNLIKLIQKDYHLK